MMFILPNCNIRKDEQNLPPSEQAFFVYCRAYNNFSTLQRYL